MKKSPHYKIKSMEGKSVLVLGGLGFIGSNTAHRCCELGAEVAVFDAMLEPYGFNMENLEGIRERVKFVKADMRDFSALAEEVKGKGIIFNCAGQVSHVDSMENPMLDMELNIGANINLLEACRKYNDKATVVYAGTRGEFGRALYLPMDEKHPADPVDVYGINKLAAEKYHLLYASTYGIKACSLRLTNTYGERHQMKHAKYGIMNWFIRLALEGKEIPLYGGGKMLRDYLYVRDVADAMVMAAQEGKCAGKFYSLGNGKGIRFVEIVKKIIKEAGSGSWRNVEFPPERKRIEIGDMYFSHRMFSRDTGWKPSTGLDEGIERTISFYRERLGKYT
ncbi:MAG: NAD-dependent epimerase/dehydratase family protein [Candidatus Diapherotrites archaeon]